MALFWTSILVISGLYGFTLILTRSVERRFPAHGDLTDVGGYCMHALHVERPESADLPAIVFIHGASGNLRDQSGAFLSALEGRAEMLFVDRPGHGWSERGGSRNAYPDAQARAIADLMDRKGIEDAIVVGHSFGGVIAAAMALERPERVRGLLLLASPTHPWQGGVDFYYRLVTIPVIGRLFCELLVMPLGLVLAGPAVKRVFAPDLCADDYEEKTAIPLVLRPRQFLANARDVVRLFDHIVVTAPKYRAIKAPAVILSGLEDTVVSPLQHSVALAEEMDNAELLLLEGVGHKPDYVATGLCTAALEKLSGAPVDLEALKHAFERHRAATMQDKVADNTTDETSAQMPDMPSEPI